jgi:micrococcal nuclease
MYEYRATVVSVYDADTVRLDVDLGFNTWVRNWPFRLNGIDAPELGTPAGRAARDYLRSLCPPGAQLTAITIKDRAEKYGRMLADLYHADDPVNSINQDLIDAGHAVAYSGGPR